MMTNKTTDLINFTLHYTKTLIKNDKIKIFLKQSARAKLKGSHINSTENNRELKTVGVRAWTAASQRSALVGNIVHEYGK